MTISNPNPREGAVHQIPMDYACSACESTFTIPEVKGLISLKKGICFNCGIEGRLYAIPPKTTEIEQPKRPSFLERFFG